MSTHRTSAVALTNRVILGLSLLTAGCETRSAEAVVTSALLSSRVAPTSELEGTCSTYAREVCARAGEDSASCAGFKNAAELMSERTCSLGLEDLSQSLEKLGALRQPCNELRDELCGSFGADSEMCDFVTVQTRLFPVEQCKTMLTAVPDVVRDLQQLHAGKRPLTADLSAAIASGGGPGFGPPDASIEIVEFSDFECPYCAQAARVMQTIRERYGTKVRFVFRQYPLPIHANAELAARASLAAHAQGRFWEFHDMAFKVKAPLDQATLERIAREAGLDVARFSQTLSDDGIREAVETDVLLGQQVQVAGTPALYINGRRIEHPTDLTTVINAIERAQKDPT